MVEMIQDLKPFRLILWPVFNRLGMIFNHAFVQERQSVTLNLVFLIPLPCEPMPYSFSWIRRISQAGTLFFTRFCGEAVGVDSFGNRYFIERKPAKGQKPKRWVIYQGDPEPSKIPPEWHGWMHSIAEAPLNAENRFAWQQPHEPNQTGTSSASYPPGHMLSGQTRSRATGDYEAWRPSD